MFSTWGALTGLAIAIVLIIRKTAPAYALVAGALAGGLIGGGGLPETVGAMISGAQSMMPSVLRILTSGILAGALFVSFTSIMKSSQKAKATESVSNAKTALEALAAVPGVLSDPAPMAEVKSLDDSAVTLTVRAWSRTADYWGVYFAGIQGVKEAFDRAGVAIPFPQLDVHVIK